MTVASATASATSPRPEPSTTPTRGRRPARSVSDLRGLACGSRVRVEVERQRQQLTDRRRQATAPGRPGGPGCPVPRTRPAAGGSRRMAGRTPSARDHGHLRDPRLPAATSAPSAEASAHWPCGYAAFSTLEPTYTSPSTPRSAAPTGKCECARARVHHLVGGAQELAPTRRSPGDRVRPHDVGCRGARNGATAHRVEQQVRVARGDQVRVLDAQLGAQPLDLLVLGGEVGARLGPASSSTNVPRFSTSSMWMRTPSQISSRRRFSTMTSVPYAASSASCSGATSATGTRR